MTQDIYEQWWNVEEIFAQALDLPTEEREAFLDQACGDDLYLRQQIKILLDTQKTAEGFLDDPADWFNAPLLPGLGVEENEAAEVATLDGQQIGAYRLLNRIGYGGMGTVYLAERADGQFRQRVALKLLRRGRPGLAQRLDSRETRWQHRARILIPAMHRIGGGSDDTGHLRTMVER